MGARFAVAQLALLAAAAACSSDLFHSTEWQPRCGAPGCGGAQAGSGGSGGAAQTGAGGASCSPGATAACYDGPPNTAGVGVCKAGTHTCLADGNGFGPCMGEVVPTAERCDTAVDDNCDGTVNEACAYTSCAAVPQGLGSGVYPITVAAQGTFGVYCDLSSTDGAWALVYASVGSTDGATLGFWQIAYADRLTVKGTPSPKANDYAGALYLVGTEYKDEIEDLAGTVVEAFRATAAGFDSNAMTFNSPALETGNPDVFNCQFASGWSSTDHDGDTDATDNCASLFSGVTQHYCSCWNVNLGSDADAPVDDGGWGPHVNTSIATALGLTSDGTSYTRVNRVLRWTRW